MNLSCRLLVWLMLAAGMSFSGTAHAATTCSITSMSNLTFGTVDPTGATVDVTATLDYQCVFTGFLTASSVSLCFNVGSGSGGATFAPRVMKSGIEPMNFQIYADAARTQIWGASTAPGIPPVATTLQFPLTIGSATRNGSLTLYGRIPTGQTTLATGNYASAFAGNNALMTYGAAEALLAPPVYPTCTLTGNDNFDFNVSATVAPRCQIGTATDMSFGSIPSNFASNQDQTSIVTMTCTRNTAWQVGLDNGQNSVGTTRRMLGGGRTIVYELYRDSGRMLRWGATFNSDTLIGSGNGSAQPLSVYGRVAPQAAVPAGAYSDKITVTVTF
jgi:spore coat protein U-like protein